MAAGGLLGGAASLTVKRILSSQMQQSRIRWEELLIGGAQLARPDQ